MRLCPARTSLVLLFSTIYQLVVLNTNGLLVASAILPQEQVDLSDALKLWNEQQPLGNPYEFTFQRSCFCVQEIRAAKRVKVDDFQIVSVLTLSGDEVSENAKKVVLTIPEVFDLIQGAIDGHADALSVKYHPESGYPQDVVIDYDYSVAHDEVYITIQDLMFLEGATEETANESEETANETPDVKDQAMASLQAAQDLWLSKGVSYYSITFQRACDCAYEFTIPMTLIVRDQHVIEVRASIPLNPTIASTVGSIEQNFQRLSEYIQDESYAIVVMYHKSLGYPQYIQIGSSYQKDSSEDFSITISDFQDLSEHDHDDNGDDSSIEDNVSQEEKLRTAREKWESVGTTNYKFQFLRECFCSYQFLIPLQVTVTDGTVTEMVSDRGLPVYPDVFSSVGSIDQTFDLIQEAMDAGANAIHVVYNSDYGYPEGIVIDNNKDGYGDELSIKITGLTFLDEEGNSNEDSETSVEEEFRQARHLWEEQGPDTYFFGLHISSCASCTEESMVPMWVHVFQGKISGATTADEDNSKEVTPDVFTSLPTIDELFDLIEGAIEWDSNSVHVVYDLYRGYPQTLWIRDYDYHNMGDSYDFSEPFSIDVFYLTEVKSYHVIPSER